MKTFAKRFKSKFEPIVCSRTWTSYLTVRKAPPVTHKSPTQHALVLMKYIISFISHKRVFLFAVKDVNMSNMRLILKLGFFYDRRS